MLAEFKKNYKNLIKIIKTKMTIDESLKEELTNTISSIKNKFLEGKK